VGLLVVGLGDHAADAAGPEVSADRARGVGLVGQHPVGPGPWPADRALDTQVREQRQHHRRVTGLAGGEQDGQRAAPSVDRGVDLRAQPAARAAEGVIARFVPAAARILVIRHRPCVLDEHGAILPGTALGRSRMLVRPHDRGVDRHVPIHPTGRVGLSLNHAQQLVPRAIGREAMMSLPHRLPRPEPPRKITPRHPGPIPEHDALDHLTMITPRTTTTHRLRHQRLDQAHAASLGSAERVTWPDWRNHHRPLGSHTLVDC